VQQPNWETDPSLNQSCYRDTGQSSMCSQGDVPVYGVAVQSISDIAAAVNFSAARNLRLVIKNTGHDYLGRSSGGGALSIWTHNMKNISFSSNYEPVGSGGKGVGTTVTIGAGVQLAELYAAVGHADQSVVVGLAHTVGAAGGYIQGGGHSPLGPWKGQSTDNAIEFEVVIANVISKVCFGGS
jgi:FAD/FMN-containing dehydrogenase